MKINICIVEDEVTFAESLSILLKKWGNQNNVLPDISIFSSRKTLLQNDPFHYSVIFMDIELNSDSGIKIANFLRQQGYSGEIIFLTAHQEYVFEGYHVHALDYLIKPVTYSQLDACMQYVRRKLSDTYFSYYWHNEYIRIPYHKILYFSSQNQYIEICTSDYCYRKRHSLKELVNSLPPQFVQCHRTAIINIDHVVKISGKNVFLSNKASLPVSDTYLSQVRSIYVKALKGESL